jgi:hypothetical protein
MVAEGTSYRQGGHCPKRYSLGDLRESIGDYQQKPVTMLCAGEWTKYIHCHGFEGTLRGE